MFTLGLFGVLCGVVLWACFEREEGGKTGIPKNGRQILRQPKK